MQISILSDFYAKAIFLVMLGTFHGLKLILVRFLGICALALKHSHAKISHKMVPRSFENRKDESTYMECDKINSMGNSVRKNGIGMLKPL